MRPRQWARREVGASEGGLAHEGTWEKQADFHFMCILLGEASLSRLRCFEKLERKEKPQTHLMSSGKGALSSNLAGIVLLGVCVCVWVGAGGALYHESTWARCAVYGFKG